MQGSEGIKRRCPNTGESIPIIPEPRNQSVSGPIPTPAAFIEQRRRELSGNAPARGHGEMNNALKSKKPKFPDGNNSGEAMKNESKNPKKNSQKKNEKIKRKAGHGKQNNEKDSEPISEGNGDIQDEPMNFNFNDQNENQLYSSNLQSEFSFGQASQINNNQTFNPKEQASERRMNPPSNFPFTFNSVSLTKKMYTPPVVSSDQLNPQMSAQPTIFAQNEPTSPSVMTLSSEKTVQQGFNLPPSPSQNLCFRGLNPILPQNNIFYSPSALVEKQILSKMTTTMQVFQSLPQNYEFYPFNQLKLKDLKHSKPFFLAYIRKMKMLANKMTELQQKQARLQEHASSVIQKGFEKVKCLKMHNQEQMKIKNGLFQSGKILNTIMNQSKMFAEVIVQNQKRVKFQYTDPDQGVVLMAKYLLQAWREAEQKVVQIQLDTNQDPSRVIEIELLEDEINKIYEVSAKLSCLQLNIVNLKRTVGKSKQQRLSALIQEKIMKEKHEQWKIHDLVKECERMLCLKQQKSEEWSNGQIQ